MSLQAQQAEDQQSLIDWLLSPALAPDFTVIRRSRRRVKEKSDTHTVLDIVRKSKLKQISIISFKYKKILKAHRRTPFYHLGQTRHFKAETKSLCGFPCTIFFSNLRDS